MNIKVFTIPTADPGGFQDELNAFLSGHKVLEIEQKFFQNESGGYWTFCVRYINGGVVPSAQNQFGKKIDYREILSDKDFSVFSKLRTIRKELAAADGSPAYVVFTDEELAKIAQLPELTEKALSEIRGVGEKKVAKYGKALIDKYNASVQIAPAAATQPPTAGAPQQLPTAGAPAVGAGAPFGETDTVGDAL